MHVTCFNVIGTVDLSRLIFCHTMLPYLIAFNGVCEIFKQINKTVEHVLNLNIKIL